MKTKQAPPAPGRELDALVAEKVMGLRVKRNRITGLMTVDPDSGNTERGLHPVASIVPPLHRYSTDISAAWEVVEKIVSLTCDESFHLDSLGFDGEEWRCILWQINDEKSWSLRVVGEAATAPEAICLAALKAVERCD